MQKEATTAGKVYLVGAGPSDPGLLTIKGLKVLQRAQAVIYDALIGPGVYSLIPQSAEKIFVGKRAGRHSLRQEQISRLILEQALLGRIVVRLKGGDPFLFGRGAEELELLESHGIAYEIVPGVTSALAVPAYAGIPVTCRGVSSSVHILTGHKKEDEALDLDFAALLRAGGTYVFLMGMSALHEITTGFLQAGMAPEMPAAVIAQGTGAGQRSVIAQLASLEQEVCRQGLQAPAVIVIGEAALLGERLSWRERLPLAGCRIAVTRPTSRSERLTELLREQGAEVMELPMISTRLRDCKKQLAQALSAIRDYEYLVFTSAAGVDCFFELLDEMELDVRCIGTVKLAVIGNATGAALKKRGLRPELVPERYNSTALGRLLGQSVPAGGKLLLLRSSMAGQELVDEIQKAYSRAGTQSSRVEITDLAVYDTVYTYGEAAADDGLYEKALLESGQIDMVMFTSASTVRGFMRLAAGLDVSKVRAVCIGSMTAAQACVYGMQVYQAQKETVESMVQAAVQVQQANLCPDRV